MSAFACALCGTRSGTVDGSGGLCAICASFGDATDVRVIVARGLWALDRMQRERNEKKKARESAQRQMVAADAELAGGSLVDDVCIRASILALSERWPEHKLGEDDVKRAMHTLVAYRALRLKTEPVFESGEWQPLRQMLTTFRASQLAAMIKAGAADPYCRPWVASMITMRANVQRLHTLARNGPPQSASDRKPALLAEWTALSAVINAGPVAARMKLAPIVAPTTADYLDNITAKVEAARAICAEHGLEA